MQHICTHEASVSMSAWRKCAETVPQGLNTTYTQTLIYIRQTGLPFFLAVLLSALFSVLYLETTVGLRRQKNSHLDLELHLTLLSMSVQHIIFNILIMMLKGYMASSFFFSGMFPAYPFIYIIYYTNYHSQGDT